MVEENLLTTRVLIEERGDVVDLSLENAPHVLLAILPRLVLRNFLLGNLLGHRLHHTHTTTVGSVEERE